MMTAVLNLIIRLAGWATLLAMAFKSGSDKQKQKQLEADNANLNKQAQDWSDRPRNYDAFSKRLRDAARRKDKS